MHDENLTEALPEISWLINVQHYCVGKQLTDTKNLKDAKYEKTESRGFSVKHPVHFQFSGDKWREGSGFPRGSAVKNPPGQGRRCGFYPWVREIPGGANGNWLQYSCLGNLTDRGTRWATVHGVAKTWT